MSAPPLPTVTLIPNTEEFCCPGPPTVYKDKIYFAASRNFGDNPIGRELFVLDPATGSTNLFLDINPGPDESSPNSLTVFNDMLYFFSYTTGIWRTDGTVSGTVLVSDILPSSFDTPVEVNGDLYVSGDFDDGTAGFLRISPPRGPDDGEEGEGDDNGSGNGMLPKHKGHKGGKGYSMGMSEKSKPKMKKRMGKGKS